MRRIVIVGLATVVMAATLVVFAGPALAVHSKAVSQGAGDAATDAGAGLTPSPPPVGVVPSSCAAPEVCVWDQSDYGGALQFTDEAQPCNHTSISSVANNSTTLTVFLYDSANCTGQPAQVTPGEAFATFLNGAGTGPPQSVQVLDGSSGGAPAGMTAARKDALFTTYLTMAACFHLLHPMCYEFADGTVVGETTSLGGEVGNALSAVLDPKDPFGQCVAIPTFGISPNIMYVFNGTGVELLIGPGSCSDLSGDLKNGSADLIASGAKDPINSVDASAQGISCKGSIAACAKAAATLAQASGNATSGRSNTVKILGGLGGSKSLSNYCASLGYLDGTTYQGGVWKCNVPMTSATGKFVINMNSACVWAYGTGATAYEQRSGDPNSWVCRR